MKNPKNGATMMERALAKAEQEAVMLDGTGSLMDQQPFQLPEFVLPDPIEVCVSLCGEIEQILGVKVS